MELKVYLMSPKPVIHIPVELFPFRFPFSLKLVPPFPQDGSRGIPFARIPSSKPVHASLSYETNLTFELEAAWSRGLTEGTLSFSRLVIALLPRFDQARTVRDGAAVHMPWSSTCVCLLTGPRYIEHFPTVNNHVTMSRKRSCGRLVDITSNQYLVVY